MIDCLPRIQIAREHDISFFSRTTLVLHSRPAAYEAQSLRLGCLDGHDTKWLKSNEVIECKELLVPPPLQYSDLSTKILALQRFFAHALSLEAGPSVGDQRIYISRIKASKRRLVREDRIIEYLLPLGFRVISLEDFSLEQQIFIFRDASCVVAPHGAGLALTAFMRKDCHVVEIISSHCPKDFYRDIANFCGLQYWRIYANPQTYSPVGNFISADPIHGNANDLIVSGEVVNSLKKVLSHLA
jgi:capsular polysaccharide biosynthesis protein